MLKQIPKTENIEFKKAFIERYSKLTNWNEFKKYCLSFLRKSIRVNTLKISIPELKKRLESQDWLLESIPWCKQGFFVEHKDGRRDIGHLKEHALGYFYVQEAASMIPPLALEPKPGELVLDMAAAPGSKATQLSAIMENKGIIIANDVDLARLPVLKLNLQKSSVSNVVITHMKAELIKNQKFDKILLDAPCSGTGIIRKKIQIIDEWNLNMIKGLAKTQKKLIENAFSLLKKSGVMTYSTCSLEPEENEAVVNYLLENHKDAKVEEIKLNIKHGSAVMQWEKTKFNPQIKNCLRLWPQDNNTEGFFVAKIRKL